VNQPGEHLFACAGLTSNEHWDIGACDASGYVQHVYHFFGCKERARLIFNRLGWPNRRSFSLGLTGRLAV
jgi:hypothetical protein